MQTIFKQDMGKMKHIYQDIIGWFTFPRFYSDMVNKFPSGSKFVEVGTYIGKSFSYLMVEAHNAKKDFGVYAVDSYTFNDDFNNSDENIEFVFRRNLKDFEGKFTVIKGDSAESASQFEDNSLDLVFLDADHVFERVLGDIEAWWPKIKKGGILAGHDYCKEHEGVIEAVDKTFGNHWDKTYLDELVWMKIK